MHKGAIALVLALSLSGCASGTSIDNLSELSHIHNVVLTDETVFIGSHEGLFVSSGEARWQRVGDEFDFMALTTVDDTLLASGHPGRGSDLPDPAGLISSDDYGNTWDTRSLTGEVDFHLLEASGQTIIGVAANYGALVKSGDSGATWETLDVPPLTDLAIDPSHSESVVLATEHGLQRSDDGASTFTLIPTIEKPTLLHWSDAGLFGATSESVWKWNDTSDDWELVRDGFDDIHAFATSAKHLAVLDGDTLTNLAM